MARFIHKLAADRLIDAADELLKAAALLAEITRDVRRQPTYYMGGPLQPECLDPIARWEVQEAWASLVRGGSIEENGCKRAA